MSALIVSGVDVPEAAVLEHTKRLRWFSMRRWAKTSCFCTRIIIRDVGKHWYIVNKRKPHTISFYLQISNPTRPLSVALFAPAWSFEKRDELCSVIDAQNQPLRTINTVYTLDKLFWQPLIPLLSRLRALGSQTTHIYRPIKPWGRLTGTVIDTHFSHGLGLYGENDGKDFEPWSRLSEQQVGMPLCLIFSRFNRLAVHYRLEVTRKIA